MDTPATIDELFHLPPTITPLPRTPEYNPVVNMCDLPEDIRKQIIDLQKKKEEEKMKKETEEIKKKLDELTKKKKAEKRLMENEKQ